MAHKRDKPGKSCCKCVLQKTMKGADKAIVAKCFGKWKSSSLRSRTMEKPDEPSEERQERSLPGDTCEAPKVSKKALGKTLHSFRPHPCCFHIAFIIEDIFPSPFLLLVRLSGLPYPVNKQTTLLGRRIPFEEKCVSDDTELPGKDKAKNSKHKNSHRCMGKREERVNGHCSPREVFQC